MNFRLLLLYLVFEVNKLAKEWPFQLYLIWPQLYTERPSPSGDEDQLEGSLVRKHEWESTTKKASNR